MDSIHIALASDNNYAQHLGVTMISVLENKQTDVNILFHVLENGLSDDNKNKIISIINKDNSKVQFYNINEEQIKNFPEIGHLSKATYLRLFIPSILPADIKKVIYLDCDLVVLKDLTGLFMTDLIGKAMGAVRDVKSTDILRIYFYPGLKSYFNAGVLLINTESWRNLNLFERFVIFINDYKNKLSTADQDVLNCLLKDNWYELPATFNTDMKHESLCSLPSPETVVIHYSDKIKPWSYLYCGKNKKYYFKYLAMSPWADFQYTDKNLRNFFKKYFLASNKTIRNILRPLVPNSLIDWNKKSFLRKNSL